MSLSTIVVNGADYSIFYLLSQLNDVSASMVLALIISFVVYLPLRCCRIRLPLGFITTTLLFGIISYTVVQKTLNCNLELGKEYPVIYDEAGMENVVSSLVDNGKLPAGRLQHEKSHGCVVAEFTVDPNIGSTYQHGIFATPGKKYDAIIRFSSGSQKVQNDSTPDTRGMAIKIFNVQGDRLLTLPGVENTTQDIIMISNPFFFTANPNTYVPLLKTLSGGGAQLLEWVFSIFPPQVSVLIKAGIIAFQGTTVTNPLEAPYYSTTPYRIGSSEQRAYKFSVKPCANETKEFIDTKHPNYLAEALQDYLEKDDACFNFFAQPQVDACIDPMEDPTTMWHGSTVKIATLKVKKVKGPVNTPAQQAYCKSMSYNPWHGLQQHKPLGNINNQRKIAYLAGYKTRTTLNKGNFTEPSFDQFVKLGN